MKQFLLIFLCVITLHTTGQEKKKEKLVDQHVLVETLRKGETGLAKTEMSVYATSESLALFLKKNDDQDYLLFPETRENSIRLLDGIPETWTERSKKQRSSFSAIVQPGEYFTFQLGVYAVNKKLSAIQWQASGLKDITCFNLEGVGNYGNNFSKSIDVKKGRVQPLWFGVEIPEDAQGTIMGQITIKPDNGRAQKIAVIFKVVGEVVANKGFDDGNRFSRLAWLNSTIAQDDEVTSGYIPIEVSGNSFTYIGREVVIAENGLPQSINSYFGPNNQHLKETPEAILSDACRFVVETTEGKLLHLKPGKLKFTKKSPSTIAWEVKNSSREIDVVVKAEAEFDGFMDYRLLVVSKKNIAIKDIRLEIPITREKSGYLMGMGKEGGFRPENWHWKWNVDTRSQDAVWVGGVNGGLRLKLKGGNYHRQLVNIYYKFFPLNLPASWGNGQKGGCDILTTSKGALVKAFSGERNLEKGSALHFDFELLVTPVKMINKKVQYNDRYYHSNSDVSANYIPAAERAGANIINIHHKKDINPFINYPYLPENVPALKQFIREAHAKNIRTKVYYTTRELTVNTPEIWAMRSLNGEVIFPGPGKDAKTVVNKKGAHPWLVENFKEDFIPAWKCTFTDGPYKGRQDLSVITVPDSRLNNFYLEGLDWMCKNLKVDGMYIDDSALDRVTLKRARKILDRNRDNARIDMHTWNHFNAKAGFACCLNLYMDLLPYYDQLWIGEGRSYDKSPDYWLIETVGIPFGLTSQMLNHGGNRWRGMIFGMTNRLGWYGPTPEHIWKFWDAQKIQYMDMIGFWDENCPVRTTNTDMVVTVYKGKEKSIIAVANWTKESQSGKLLIDWNKLGMNPNKIEMTIPFIKEYQERGKFSASDAIDIDGGKGFLIVVTGKVR